MTKPNDTPEPSPASAGSGSSVSVHAAALRALIDAWIEMRQFGAHEGECDNTATCEKCGTALAGCSRHMEAVNRRFEAMDKAVKSLKGITC